MRFTIKFILITFILVSNAPLFAQGEPLSGVGIGIPKPDQSAVLDVYSETGTKGMLIPRVPDRNNVENTETGTLANGLLVIQDAPDNDDTGQLSENNLYQYNAAINSWQAVFPRGGIIMWSGSVDDIPAGWALCDGEGITPDLRGRFILGFDENDNTTPAVADKNDTNYGAIGNTGGSNNVELTTDEMPSHNHSITDPGHDHTMESAGDHRHKIGSAGDRGPGGGGDEPRNADDNVERTYDTSLDGAHTHTINSNITGITSTNDNGDGEAHENRPPYYVLAFIMKL